MTSEQDRKLEITEETRFLEAYWICHDVMFSVPLDQVEKILKQLKKDLTEHKKSADFDKKKVD